MIATGVNDASCNGLGVGWDLESAESDLQALMEKARDRANKALLVGCSPADPSSSVRDTGYRIRDENLGRTDDMELLLLSENRDAAEFIDLAARSESDSFSWSDGTCPDTDGKPLDTRRRERTFDVALGVEPRRDCCQSYNSTAT
nr:MAG: hypothetical protein J07AB56_06380 [Candidatus Nanosalinarum sp. J07AB56]